MISRLKFTWVFVFIFVIFIGNLQGQTSIKVPAVAQLWLAGQSPGAEYQSNDSAPLNSPVKVDIPLVSGQGLKVIAKGLVGLYGAQPTLGPSGSQGSGYFAEAFGLAGLIAPPGSLVGVFLSDLVNSDAKPPRLDFSGGAKDLEVVSPLLQQPFFIGSGITTDGVTKKFVVPKGATRLFLGVAGTSSPSKTGSFTVTISVVSTP